MIQNLAFPTSEREGDRASRSGSTVVQSDLECPRADSLCEFVREHRRRDARSREGIRHGTLPFSTSDFILKPLIEKSRRCTLQRVIFRRVKRIVSRCDWKVVSILFGRQFHVL